MPRKAVSRCPTCQRVPSDIPPYPDGVRWNNLAGQHFGRLTPLHRSPHVPGEMVKWCCRCACGGAKVVLAQNLVAGHTTSCGCVLVETARRPRVNTHPPTFRCWTYLRKHYRDQVDPAWRASFPTFLRDVGPRPTADALLRRIDPTVPYQPGNVHWVVRATLPYTATKQRRLACV